ncbi:pentapeptide repeat-containing protein [Desulfovibrio sp. UCD-KL4C]|uniref:pentapeptide repeat-containing protein n=1 Tax=Desulfovibrio sp. UCD-KL4C TaxID=2578120 RepID=UPI0025BA2EE0|nr:pentapeptide repeat-containing protein [Desulfovibrio sp. UCD-KL4C]
MACCIGAKHDHWCKVHDIVYIDKEGNEYCVFHAPSDHKYRHKNGPKVTAEQFNHLVFSIANSYADRSQQQNEYIECNLSGTIFPYDINFSLCNTDKILESLNFNDCLFKGIASFNGCRLNGCSSFNRTTFKGKALFDAATFNGECNFKCTFELDSYFKNCTFTQSACFEQTQFIKGAFFNNAMFFATTSFLGVEFHDVAKFKESKLCARITFNGSKFHSAAVFNQTVCNDDLASFQMPISFSNVDFLGVAYFEECDFKGPIDFHNVKFKGYTSFQSSFFKQEATFEKTIFYAEVNFSQIQYDKRITVFNAESIFRKTVFKDTVDISNVDFDCNVKFEEVDINGPLQCFNSKFKKAEFTKINFNDRVHFSGSKFNEALFFCVFFEKQAYFNDMTLFYTSLKIDNCSFKMAANFNHAAFITPGDLTIKDTTFDSWAYFRNVTFGRKISFEDTICEKTILIEGDDVDLSGMEFTNINIESFKFIGCHWGKNKYGPIYDELNDTSPAKLEEIYRRLKRLAVNNSDQIQASSWHYREKKCLLKTSFNNLREEPSNWFKLIYLGLYYLFSGFGEKPLRAFIWLLIFIVTPFFIPPESLNSYDPIWLKNSINYLPIIKTSSELPSLATLVQGFWRLFITIQAALFAFALRNKLRR